MSDNKYPIGGYAPGNYTCKCTTCGERFMGDKRAVQCEPCAIKMTDLGIMTFYILDLQSYQLIIKEMPVVKVLDFSYMVGEANFVPINKLGKVEYTFEHICHIPVLNATEKDRTDVMVKFQTLKAIHINDLLTQLNTVTDNLKSCTNFNIIEELS